MRSIVALSLLAFVTIACGPTPAATNVSPPAALAAGEFALPTDTPIVLPSGVVEACGGVGINAVVHGDPRDPKIAWLTTDRGGRIDVTWPAGYRARFQPALEVLDPTGAVVLHEGQPVNGGCVTTVPEVLHLEPPFR